jgi:hypothetical protein
MNRCRLPLAIFVLAALVCHARAGIFSKRAKPNPAERVPELIVTLRTDLDEHKRTAAAEELKQYDPVTFPEIIPTLAEVAQHDPKAGVRSEALQTLAKLRPISHQAGLALEQAAHDDSMRVRMQARNLLFGYRLAGYRAAKTPDLAAPTNVIRTEEPPLASAMEAPPVTNSQRPLAVPPAPMVSTPTQPASQFASGSSERVSPNGKPGAAEGRAIRWAPATPAPKTLPAQPQAVPLDPRLPTTGTVKTAPRGSSSGAFKAATGVPRSLPNGPARPASPGPKPLPEGPESEPASPTAESSAAAQVKSTKEPPLAPSEDEGPELTP